MVAGRALMALVFRSPSCRPPLRGRGRRRLLPPMALPAVSWLVAAMVVALGTPGRARAAEALVLEHRFRQDQEIFYRTKRWLRVEQIVGGEPVDAAASSSEVTTLTRMFVESVAEDGSAKIRQRYDSIGLVASTPTGNLVWSTSPEVSRSGSAGAVGQALERLLRPVSYTMTKTGGVVNAEVDPLVRAIRDGPIGQHAGLLEKLLHRSLQTGFQEYPDRKLHTGESFEAEIVYPGVGPGGSDLPLVFTSTLTSVEKKPFYDKGPAERLVTLSVSMKPRPEVLEAFAPANDPDPERWLVVAVEEMQGAGQTVFSATRGLVVQQRFQTTARFRLAQSRGGAGSERTEVRTSALERTYVVTLD